MKKSKTELPLLRVEKKEFYLIMETKVKKRTLFSSPVKIQNLLGIAVLALFFLFSGNQILAACPTGLVPCGTSDCPCTFCNIFALIDNILDFVIFNILLPVAALILIIGGFFLLIAGGNPEQFNRAKSILTAAVIGLVIIFVAFIFIGTFLKYIGLAQWTTDIYHSWWEEGLFQFPCQ
jgi:FtsH-binding integral membrane protein